MSRFHLIPFRDEGRGGASTVPERGGRRAEAEFAHPEVDPGVRLDDLTLRDAVLGEALVLIESGGGELTLHELTGGHVHPIGSFANAAEAWEAVDAVDDRATGYSDPPGREAGIDPRRQASSTRLEC